MRNNTTADYRERTGLPIVEWSCELTSMMSTEQVSTFEVSTETTAVEIGHTIGSSMTSSSRGAGFYFQYAVLVVGIVGAATNGLVLYAMLASNQHKKHVLIFNQNVFDLVNCLNVIARFSVIIRSIYLSGSSGYWLCLAILSSAGSYATLVGSLINLAAVSIERYLKVVHHVWAKKKLRNWMIYSVTAFAWISGIVIAAAVIIPTTAVVNGVCYPVMFFSSTAGRKVYALWDFISFYVITLLIFIFCYGRILMAVRRQAKVMAAHGTGGSNAAQDQSNKMQTSVIKTMILVSGLFAITAAPVFMYSLYYTFHPQLTVDQNGLYALMSTAYIYVCINPFIYAIKFDPVKRVLLGLIPCKKNTQPSESVNNT